MTHDNRPQRPTTARTNPRSDAAERRSARRRRSVQLVAHGVISAYIHDLSQRHRPPTLRAA